MPAIKNKAAATGNEDREAIASLHQEIQVLQQYMTAMNKASEKSENTMWTAERTKDLLSRYTFSSDSTQALWSKVGLYEVLTGLVMAVGACCSGLAEQILAEPEVTEALATLPADKKVFLAICEKASNSKENTRLKPFFELMERTECLRLALVAARGDLRRLNDTVTSQAAQADRIREENMLLKEILAGAIHKNPNQMIGEVQRSRPAKPSGPSVETLQALVADLEQKLNTSKEELKAADRRGVKLEVELASQKNITTQWKKKFDDSMAGKITEVSLFREKDQEIDKLNHQVEDLEEKLRKCKAQLQEDIDRLEKQARERAAKEADHADEKAMEEAPTGAGGKAEALPVIKETTEADEDERKKGKEKKKKRKDKDKDKSREDGDEKTGEEGKRARRRSSVASSLQGEREAHLTKELKAAHEEISKLKEEIARLKKELAAALEASKSGSAGGDTTARGERKGKRKKDKTKSEKDTADAGEKSDGHSLAIPKHTSEGALSATSDDGAETSRSQNGPMAAGDIVEQVTEDAEPTKKSKKKGKTKKKEKPAKEEGNNEALLAEIERLKRELEWANSNLASMLESGRRSKRGRSVSRNGFETLQMLGDIPSGRASTEPTQPLSTDAADVQRIMEERDKAIRQVEQLARDNKKFAVNIAKRDRQIAAATRELEDCKKKIEQLESDLDAARKELEKYKKGKG